MQLIDTHCHLTHKRLADNAAALLERACAAGVAAVICAASDLDESRAALAAAHWAPNLLCMAGVHPHEAKSVPEDYLSQLAALAADAKNVAIGEIGLDYHYDFSPRPQQQAVFEGQVELACTLGKPVVVHTREAFDDTLAILRNSALPGGRIVFHSFTENLNCLRLALELGAMVSFSGIVTFKKSFDLQDAARFAPADRILVETDAPFLSPEPVRSQKNNEPANVAHTAAFLAKLRNASVEEIAQQTTQNALRFFGMTLQTSN